MLAALVSSPAPARSPTTPHRARVLLGYADRPEGLLLPPVKLLERGRRNRAVYDVIAANVRDPAATLGDLEAQLAACRRGSERLGELCTRFSTGAVQSAMAGLLAQTSARTVAELTTWPSRRVETEGWLDDDGSEPRATCADRRARSRYERERSTSISQAPHPRSRRGERPVG